MLGYVAQFICFCVYLEEVLVGTRENGGFTADLLINL